MTYIRVGQEQFPAEIQGCICDRTWNNRETRAITFAGTYETASARFADGAAWSIIDTAEEYDHAEFCVLGDIAVHTNGTVTVTMGKATDTETLLTLLYGKEE